MARILHVVLSLGHGGAERLVIELCRRLRRDFDFAVCCLDEPGEWANQLRAEGVAVVSLGRRPGFHPSLSAAIAKEARRLGARVLHCHEYSPFVYGTLAQVVSPGLRILSTEHGRLSTARASLKRRMATRVLTRLPATIVAVSADLRGRLVDEGYPASRVSVLLNGAAPGPEPSDERRARARRTLGLPDRDLVVGSVGRLATVKDFGTLVDAFAELRQRGVPARLAIVGDGPERPRLQAQVGRLGLGAYVCMPGHRDDVAELVPSFDVFVSSSLFEGVSLTILEAMAAALPVVATRVGGTPEVVEDGLTGLLVPQGDPHSLATAIGSLLSDPALRHEYGANGRARMVRSFNIEVMVREYAEIYRSMGAA